MQQDFLSYLIRLLNSYRQLNPTDWHGTTTSSMSRHVSWCATGHKVNSWSMAPNYPLLWSNFISWSTEFLVFLLLPFLFLFLFLLFLRNYRCTLTAKCTIGRIVVRILFREGIFEFEDQGTSFAAEFLDTLEKGLHVETIGYAAPIMANRAG